MGFVANPIRRFFVCYHDAMAKGNKKNKDQTPRLQNRRARFDYRILESFEVGVALRGSEVKSLREGRASIAEGFARVEVTDGRHAPITTKSGKVQSLVKGKPGTSPRKLKNVKLQAGRKPTLELYLLNVEISAYSKAGMGNGHESRRPRKLLAHKREIERLYNEQTVKGRTLVPLTLYFTRGFVKVELGVAEGKKSHDKREDMKKRDAEREMRRAMSHKR